MPQQKPRGGKPSRKPAFSGREESRRSGKGKSEGFKKSFKSKFSRKEDSAKGPAKPFERKKKEDGFERPQNRAFSPRKKYFKSKESSSESTDRNESKRKPFKKDDRKSFNKKDFNKKFTDRKEAPTEKQFSKPSKFTSYKNKKKNIQKPADGLIRLNKFISNSGVCSRREADELITMGLISVNGQTITELGYKIKATDDVRYENKKLAAEKPVYILLNKPKGFITTTDDPQERKTVMHLIGNAVKERIYPVGRLDRNTTGLLLLTNDGELAERLTHPSYKAKKIYRVELDKDLSKADFEKIVDGIFFEEGKAIVDDLAYVDDTKHIVGIELHIGWNRIVRRIFEALGYEVIKLDRVVYAGLDKKSIGRGEWRFLRQDEITKLKHFK